MTTDPALARLLLDLGRTGVTITPSPHRTDRIDLAPRTTPSGIAARVRLRTRPLLVLLAGEGIPDPENADDPAGYLLGERLGIADDLGLDITIGSPAWCIAIGEALGLVTNRTEHPCARAHRGAY